jgi:hypothetical protein
VRKAGRNQQLSFKLQDFAEMFSRYQLERFISIMLLRRKAELSSGSERASARDGEAEAKGDLTSALNPISRYEV